MDPQIQELENKLKLLKAKEHTAQLQRERVFY